MAKFQIMTDAKISDLGRKFPPKFIYETDDPKIIAKLRTYKPEILTEIKTISEKLDLVIEEKPIEIKADNGTKIVDKKDNRGIKGNRR